MATKSKSKHLKPSYRLTDQEKIELNTLIEKYSPANFKLMESTVLTMNEARITDRLYEKYYSFIPVNNVESMYNIEMEEVTQCTHYVNIADISRFIKLTALSRLYKLPQSIDINFVFNNLIGKPQSFILACKEFYS